MTPMVKAQGVHKLFGELHVLKGVDLTVNQGEVCVLLGPSGSGKSTLIRCINELEQISAGRIWVNGDLVGYVEKGDRLHTRNDRDIARAREHVGMVFQDPDAQLVTGSLLDEVAFGPENLRLPVGEVLARTEDALRRVVRARQKGWRAPDGGSRICKSRQAAQVNGVKQHGPDVAQGHAPHGGNLGDYLAFAHARRAP